MERNIKPKNARSKRALQRTMPKIKENPKLVLNIRGQKTSEVVNKALVQFHLMKKPFSLKLGKKNEIRPFVDPSPLEFLSLKNNGSLFVLGNHTKKRPHNLIFGRLFDHRVLDMVEFAIESSKFDFDSSKYMSQFGLRPCLLFQGDAFEHDTNFVRIKNLMLDFFKGEDISGIALSQIQHVVVFTALNEKIHFRHYAMIYEKSGGKIPDVKLVEIGPRFVLSIRRIHAPPKEMEKKSLVKPKESVEKKVKNVEKDHMGSKMGRIHVQQQDLSEIALKKMKGLKKRRRGKQENSTEDQPSKKQKK